MSAANKRGISADSAAVVIIVFAAVFIVVLMGYNALFGFAKSQYTERECQTSLLLTRVVDSKQIACYAKVPNPVPLKCAREFVTAKDDSVLQNGADVSQLYSPECPDGSSSCRVHAVVAEQLRGCWRTFFEGEQVVLQQVEVNTPWILTQKDYKRACYICSEITIDTSSDIEGLGAYLKETKMPVSKTNVTYYSYFTNRKSWCDRELLSPDAPTCFEGMAKNISGSLKSTLGISEKERPEARVGTLKKGTTYAVAFVRRGWGSCEAENAAEYTQYHLTNAVQLIPAEDIVQACDAVIV